MRWLRCLLGRHGPSNTLEIAERDNRRSRIRMFSGFRCDDCGGIRISKRVPMTPWMDASPSALKAERRRMDLASRR